MAKKIAVIQLRSYKAEIGVPCKLSDRSSPSFIWMLWPSGMEEFVIFHKMKPWL